MFTILIVDRYQQNVWILKLTYYDQNNKFIGIFSKRNSNHTKKQLSKFWDYSLRVELTNVECVRRNICWTLYITIYIMEFTRFERTRTNIESYKSIFDLIDHLIVGSQLYMVKIFFCSFFFFFFFRKTFSKITPLDDKWSHLVMSDVSQNLYFLIY